MAITSFVKCIHCGLEYREMHSVNKFPTCVCAGCTKNLDQIEYDKYFAELDGLTMEERVRKIEKWIHEQENKPMSRRGLPIG